MQSIRHAPLRQGPLPERRPVPARPRLRSFRHRILFTAAKSAKIRQKHRGAPPPAGRCSLRPPATADEVGQYLAGFQRPHPRPPTMPPRRRVQRDLTGADSKRSCLHRPGCKDRPEAGARCRVASPQGQKPKAWQGMMDHEPYGFGCRPTATSPEILPRLPAEFLQ